MPYHVEQNGDVFCVYDAEGNKVKNGEHALRRDALAQMRKLNAAESKEDSTSEKSEKKEPEGDSDYED